VSLTEAIASSSLLEVARSYIAKDLSVIPIRADGSKAPALKKGQVEQYRERFATEAELEEWFAPHKAVGIAIVCGKISGNLAVLDFEQDTVWESWIRRATDRGMAAIFETFPLVRTPRGGRHLYYRILEGHACGGKLAMRSKAETLLEIRGQGHYVLAPGCPPACHETHRQYTFEKSGWLCG